MKSNNKQKKEVDRLIGSKIVLAAKQQKNNSILIKDKRMNKAVLEHGFKTIFKSIYENSTPSFNFISQMVHNKLITHINYIINNLLIQNSLIIAFQIILSLFLLTYLLLISFQIELFSISLIFLSSIASIVIAFVVNLILIINNHFKK